MNGVEIVEDRIEERPQVFLAKDFPKGKVGIITEWSGGGQRFIGKAVIKALPKDGHLLLLLYSGDYWDNLENLPLTCKVRLLYSWEKIVLS